MKLKSIGELTYVVNGLDDPLALARALMDRRPDLLDEAVPCFDSLGLFLRQPTDLAEVETWLSRASHSEPPSSRLVEIPCRYDGPDLEEVSRRLGLGPGEVTTLHAGVEYRCYALGFSPGFAYLGYLPDGLVLPRRDEPRTRVPAGSVAIAGRQTAVYPESTPGGWWLIGSTDLPITNEERSFFAIHPGDRVRFVPA